MGVTRELASFVVSTDFKALPKQAVAAAKTAILDCLGCILAGSTEPVGHVLKEVVEEWGGRPQAGVIGAGFRTSAPLAALANGTLGHALDYDDVHEGMGGHPSVALFPAALAVAELQGGSGADVITAYVLGLEVAGRIGLGMGRVHYDRGWHSTATLGTLGAAVAAAKILNLDQERFRQAMGLAASLASGLQQNFGTMTKPFHAGNAARNGVTAALLAQKGVTADPNIVEAPAGFCEVLCGPGTYVLDRMIQDMGRSFQVLNPGVGFKPYPCCASTHRAIRATLSLIKEHEIVAADVDKVDCAASYIASQILIHHQPTTPLQAKFSMEYCLAVALLDRDVGLEQFLPDRVVEERVQRMLTRVQMRVHPELRTRQSLESGKQFAEVTIRLRGGREFTCRQDTRPGDPDNPMSQEELEKKYRECAQKVLTHEHATESLSLLRELETLSNIKPLVDLILSKAAP